MTAGAEPAPWWHSAFAAAYREVYAHRDDASAEAEIAALAPRLVGLPGPILDAGCGDGRHLAALRRRGLPVIGADFSLDLLRCAAARAEGRRRVLRADLNQPPLAAGAFGAVLSLFTAFGYGTDAENAAQFAGLAALVAPGGWFVLDLPDPDHLRETLVPESSRRTACGWMVEERRSFDGTHVEKQVRVLDGHRVTATWRERVRVHAAHEIDGYASAARLALTERWSALDPAPGRSGRLVCWYRRALSSAARSPD